jgi:acyl carrier protein
MVKEVRMQGQLTSNGPSAAEGGVDLALLVQTVLAERFHRDPGEIKPDTRLVADLGLDSLDMIEINIALEERLKRPLPQIAAADEIQVETVGQLVAWVTARLFEAPDSRRAHG